MTTPRERLDKWFEEADKILNDSTVGPSAMRFNPDAEPASDVQPEWFWPFPY